jgi:uncharacterized repeat protein (TIGR01451 family)
VGNTLVMTIKPSDFMALDIPASPTGTAVIRTAAAGDRIFDITAFTFGNQSVIPEVQSYMNQGDSTAPHDFVMGVPLEDGLFCPGSPNLVDLSVTKTDSPDPVQAGAHLSYTLTVVNSGGMAATGVIVTDTVPADTTFVSCGGDVACSETAGTVTWNIGALNGSDSATLSLVVDTDSNLSNGSTITNTGYAVDSDQTEPAVGPPVTTQVTTLAGPSLSIAKTVQPASPVIAGRLVTYTLTVRNDGTTTANGIVVSDTLPLETTYQSCSGGDTCAPIANTVTWTIATLGANTQAVLTLVVRINPATAPGTPIENDTYGADSLETNPVQGPPVVIRVANVLWFPAQYR